MHEWKERRKKKKKEQNRNFHIRVYGSLLLLPCNILTIFRCKYNCNYTIYSILDLEHNTVRLQYNTGLQVVLQCHDVLAVVSFFRWSFIPVGFPIAVSWNQTSVLFIGGHFYWQDVPITESDWREPEMLSLHYRFPELLLMFSSSRGRYWVCLGPAFQVYGSRSFPSISKNWCHPCGFSTTKLIKFSREWLCRLKWLATSFSRCRCLML